MKKLLIIAAAILALASPLGAQMTDEQVVQYVKNAAAEGKSESQIGKELLSRGVTEAQAERIKAQYENQLNGDATSATGLSGTGQYGRRDSRNDQDIQIFDQGYGKNPGQGSGAESGTDQNVDVNNVLQSVIDNNFIYGHDIFGDRSNVTFEPNENQATPSNYVLGPGDELIIEVWGMNEATIVQTISPEGRISISQVGPLQLSGKTIAEATKLIRSKLAAKYGVSKNTIAVAWILRHPAHMQVLLGTMNPEHIKDSAAGSDITLTRQEWYDLYLAAGNDLP